MMEHGVGTIGIHEILLSSNVVIVYGHKLRESGTEWHGLSAFDFDFAVRLQEEAVRGGSDLQVAAICR